MLVKGKRKCQQRQQLFLNRRLLFSLEFFKFYELATSIDILTMIKSMTNVRQEEIDVLESDFLVLFSALSITSRE